MRERIRREGWVGMRKIKKKKKKRCEKKKGERNSKEGLGRG